MTEAISKSTTYSDVYIDKCFQVWYLAGRPPTHRALEMIPEDELGRKPSKSAFENWRDDYMWHGRADELDAKAIQIADDSLVLQKAEMLKRHAENAKRVADEALTFLLDGEKGFDSSASAVNAYFRGTEEERLARGISDLIVKMSKMTDGELQEKILEMLRRGSENEQIVDSEKIDTESSDDIVSHSQ